MRLSKVFENPYCIFSVLANRGCFSWLPDKMFVKLLFRSQMGKWPNLKDPKTFSEKLQWIKLYDRNPEYTKMVDKYAVKDYVAGKIGSEYVIPTLGVWDRVEDIDFDTLPDQFVLKCTHDCGGIVICRDKTQQDIAAAKQQLQKCLKKDYYALNREWPYKNVKPRIIAEQYLEDPVYKELRDYKFFCFNGEVKAIVVGTERKRGNEKVRLDFFDAEYNHFDMCLLGYHCADVPPEKPRCFEQMKVLASQLAQGIPEVRVDFYEVDGNIYFGELTFFSAGGIIPFDPECWDEIFGQWLQLPNK